MARLDAFIEKLFTEAGRELVLEAGRGAVLATPRGPQPMIKQPLTAAQIAGAVSEVVPEDLRAGFPRPGTTTFGYEAPAGAVEVRYTSLPIASRRSG